MPSAEQYGDIAIGNPFATDKTALTTTNSREGEDALEPDVKSDPQVAQILQDPPLPSLLDAVCNEMLGGGRNPERPVLSRLVLVGEIASKDEMPRNFFDDVINTAVQQVNAQDPTNGKSNTGEVIGVTGMYIEMTQHFFHMLESEPAHLAAVLSELHQRLMVRKTYDAVRNIHVAFYTDDIVHRSAPKWCVVDGSGLNPPQVQEGTEAPPLEDAIVEAVHGLMQLGTLILSQGKMQIDTFLSSTAKKDHARLIPKFDIVERCIESGMCLTLEEYLTVFSGIPKVTRPSELVQPIEPPLLY